MDVTEVRVRLAGQRGPERLLAFATVTFDNSFVVKDLRVIGGAAGPFVAMPSRKLTDSCPECGCKNHLRAGYCNDCGRHLPLDRSKLDGRGRARLHSDIAHPITSRCREELQAAVLRAYRREMERSQRPACGPRPLSPGGADDDVHSPEEPPGA